MEDSSHIPTELLKKSNSFLPTPPGGLGGGGGLAASSRLRTSCRSCSSASIFCRSSSVNIGVPPPPIFGPICGRGSGTALKILHQQCDNCIKYARKFSKTAINSAVPAGDVDDPDQERRRPAEDQHAHGRFERAQHAMGRRQHHVGGAYGRVAGEGEVQAVGEAARVAPAEIKEGPGDDLQDD